MKIRNLKIKHKFLFLILFLMILLSVSIIFISNTVSRDGMKKIMSEVISGFEEIQRISTTEFNDFMNLAEKGIKDASGLTAVETIISITSQGQKEFTDVINVSVKEVGDEIQKTLADKNQIMNTGLDDLLANSTDSLNRIIEFDNKSAKALSNLAKFNTDAMKGASVNGLKRMADTIKDIENELSAMDNQNSEDLDAVIIRFVTALEDPKRKTGDLSGMLMQEFETLKEKSKKRNMVLFKFLVSNFDTQSNILMEEMKLFSMKASFAIGHELSSIEIMQTEKMDEIITKILEKQMHLQGEIEKSVADVDQVINKLNVDLPVKLKEKGDDSTAKINAQAATIGESAKTAQASVQATLEDKKKAIAETFGKTIKTSKDTVAGIFSGSLAKTSALSSLIALSCGVIGLALGIFMIGRILKPISVTGEILKDIAEGEGDLTRRIDLVSQDEIGEMSGWFNLFIEKIQAMMVSIGKDARKLYDSSSSMSEISKDMSVSANQTFERTNKVKDGSFDVSTSMTTVNTAMDDASRNVNIVAAAAEEMNSTIANIAGNADQASAITKDAVQIANSASKEVADLGQAARKIDRVIETITDISAQVNLLALNATIEAARAGEAGKGFAVVAGEIKELAKLTAEASNEIKDQISGIQASTDGTVLKIKDITTIINKVDDIVSAVSQAVKEQSAATGEIASNVSQMYKGILDTQENVKKSSQIISVIVNDISDVTTDARQMSKGSLDVNQRAREVNELASKLTDMVGKFKV
ncbi:MAG: hypothetical protein A2277_13220 [Desulfobacterales bacterium RIFOXYA12_FULL_46_15]|nr:MAG: hypothetical protein A2277_13220 [Desulfobacterales bacterium RIFOXYA12_FULL_46_15]